MTVHAHCEERIRMLREALEHVVSHVDRDPVRCCGIIAKALSADDALAATPPPDLPLAEERDTARRELRALEWLNQMGFRTAIDTVTLGYCVWDQEGFRAKKNSWYECATVLGMKGDP